MHYYKAARHLFFFAFIFVSCCNFSFSQDCNCPEKITEQNEQVAQPAVKINEARRLITSENSICQAWGLEWLAFALIDQNQLDSAEVYLQKSESLLHKNSCGDSSFLLIHKYYARLYYTKGDFAKAQEYSFLYLRSAETANNFYEQANSYTMIAQLFNQTNRAEQGIIYTRKAIPLLNKITEPEKFTDICFKLSKRYLWHYQDTKITSSLDSSTLYSLKQIEVARKANMRSSLASAYNNLEGVAWEKEEYDKALLLLDSSFMYTDADQPDNLAVNYFDRADLLIEVRRYDEAKKNADSAFYYYEISGNKPYLADTYELMARIAKEKGDFKNAYLLKEQARNISDSIRSADAIKKVAELEKKYNQAKNEKTIKELAQQKRIYILLAAAGLFALIGLIFFIRQQSLKNKQKILETEQRLNRARMNPHFFFNALSSLQSYALEGNDGKSIASNLSKFSHIMRETLESTYKEYVTVEQEADFLNEYLELQKLRFPQKFSYEISLSKNIEPDDTLIPSMILQPFAENSIEHGFTGIDYPGHISISFDKKETSLVITITDNGKGLIQGLKENSEHISRASQIIKDRIYLLNIKLKTKASFAIDNNKNGKGVTVLIRLPLLYKQEPKV